MKSRVSNTPASWRREPRRKSPAAVGWMEGFQKAVDSGREAKKVPVRAGPLVPSPFLHNEDPASTGQARAG